MTLANQPDPMPTNKVVALAAITVLTYHFGGAIVPSEIMEAYGVLISVAIAALGTWFVPDRANVPRE